MQVKIHLAGVFTPNRLDTKEISHMMTLELQ